MFSFERAEFFEGGGWGRLRVFEFDAAFCLSQRSNLRTDQLCRRTTEKSARPAYHALHQHRFNLTPTPSNLRALITVLIIRNPPK